MSLSDIITVYEGIGGITSMEFIHKVPSVEAYNKLRVNSGMNSTKPNSEVKKALEGTLFAVSVYENNELIGLGRIVGDGGITFVVSDIMVDKKFQRRGIANKIMGIIDQWFDENTHESSFITLVAKVPADKLYSKHHFCYLPENRVGMIRDKS